MHSYLSLEQNYSRINVCMYPPCALLKRKINKATQRVVSFLNVKMCQMHLGLSSFRNNDVQAILNTAPGAKIVIFFVYLQKKTHTC